MLETGHRLMKDIARRIARWNRMKDIARRIAMWNHQRSIIHHHRRIIGKNHPSRAANPTHIIRVDHPCCAVYRPWLKRNHLLIAERLWENSSVQKILVRIFCHLLTKKALRRTISSHRSNFLTQQARDFFQNLEITNATTTKKYPPLNTLRTLYQESTNDPIKLQKADLQKNLLRPRFQQTHHRNPQKRSRMNASTVQIT